MSEIVDIVSSLKGTDVASTELSKCFAMDSCVISGDTDNLTTRRSLVASVIPNLRNASAI